MADGRTSRFVALQLAALLALAAAPVAAGDDATDLARVSRDGAERELPAAYRAWLEEVEALITARERAAFLDLGGEVERQAFVRRFWQVRDPHGATAANELEQRWTWRVPEARRRWGTLADERARVFLLQGEPSGRFESACRGAETSRFEVWIYEPGFQVRYRTAFLFAAPAAAPARLWRPGGDVAGPPADAATACGEGPRLAEEARWIRLLGAENYGAVLERALTGPRPQPADWVATFVPFSTDLPAGAPRLEAELGVDFPAHVEGKTVLRGLLVLNGLAPGDRELLLTGEVLRGTEPLDAFRYRFVVQAGVARDEPVPLAFERFVPGGPCRVVVRLEDLEAGAYFRDEQEVEVPGPGAAGPMRQEELAPPVQVAAGAVAAPGTVALAANVAPDGPFARPSPVAAQLGRLYDEAAEGPGAGSPTVRLQVPAGLLSGPVRIAARVDGGPVERVDFLLDGRLVMRRTRPPYEVRLDLGPVPRPQRLGVEAVAAGGEVLARDEVVLNDGGQRFRVRLVEPRGGRAAGRGLHARAEVEPPAGRSVERVEFYLDETRVATLYQPPYRQPIALPRASAATYVRAVAHLADGSAAEDLVMLNLPERGIGEAIDVRMVELYATVTDRAGHPVEGVEPERFRVVEDGVRQSLRRVERVADTPIRAAVLIDNSGSMRRHMPAVRAAALQFLRQTLRPQDEAAVITFNRAPRVAVGLTSDLATLAEGLTGLVAEDRTALYDSLVYTLHYLSGAKGQRTVLLLSDGVDKGSRFRFEQALESARRAGIAIYAVGMDLAPAEAAAAKETLSRLAAETGGRSFFIAGTEALPGVYREIERELRAQYRIAYQSSNAGVEDRFRLVQVQVGGPGLEARTISGYYP
ncbi:MAG TPA: VWA domain-containing protein [Thermoanaerobaculia bacterium]|nr:VWA domain-containing protein [Thermoanaerobaculia bacterium]